MRSVQRRRALLHSSRIAAVVGGRTEVTGSVRTEWSGVQPETCNQPDTCDEDKPRRDHKTRLDSVRASTVVYISGRSRIFPRYWWVTVGHEIARTRPDRVSALLSRSPRSDSLPARLDNLA